MEIQKEKKQSEALDNSMPFKIALYHLEVIPLPDPRK